MFSRLFFYAKRFSKCVPYIENGPLLKEMTFIFVFFAVSKITRLDRCIPKLKSTFNGLTIPNKYSPPHWLFHPINIYQPIGASISLFQAVNR